MKTAIRSSTCWWTLVFLIVVMAPTRSGATSITASSGWACRPHYGVEAESSRLFTPFGVFSSRSEGLSFRKSLAPGRSPKRKGAEPFRARSLISRRRPNYFLAFAFLARPADP